MSDQPDDWQPLVVHEGDRITIDGEAFTVTGVHPTYRNGMDLDLERVDDCTQETA